MGRRKRKQPSYKRMKKVPKIFTCPSCGEKSVKVANIRKSPVGTVKCGHCGLTEDVLLNSISEPVDAFGDFIDVYYADAELQRIEKRVEKLTKENDWGELSFAYGILADICKIKASEALEDEDNIDMDEANKWKLLSEGYKRKEKDALLKLETDELEKGIRTDEDSLFAEHEESGGIKKEKKIEDIFEDSGFLEF